MKSSHPLNRGPAGAAAFRVCFSTLIRGADLPRPRRLPRCAGLGVVPCSIPLGLIAGRPFNPFSRAISSRCSATIRLRSATSPSSFTTSCSSSACDRPNSSGGVVTSRLNQSPRAGATIFSDTARDFATVTSMKVTPRNNALNDVRMLLPANRRCATAVSPPRKNHIVGRRLLDWGLKSMHWL